MTPFKSLATLSGLSLQECAAYLGIPETTAYAYWYARRNPPPKFLRKLHRLASRISILAAELERGILDIVTPDKKPPSQIALRTVDTITAAKDFGLPFPSTHAAMLGLVITTLPEELASLVIFRSPDPDSEDVEIT